MIKRLIRKLLRISEKEDINDLKKLTANILIRDYRIDDSYSSIQDTEFKVFSQWGKMELYNT